MNKQAVTYQIKHYFILLIGMALMGASVAMARLAMLGTSPISSVPNVVSILLNQPLGRMSNIFQVILLIIEWFLLGRDRSFKIVIQLIPAFIFGFFIDIFMGIFKHTLPMPSYWAEFGWMVLSVIILGIGVYFEVGSQTILMTGEGVARAIALRFNLPFGRAKIYNDCAMVIAAGLISFLATGKFIGIREGTLITAMFTGVVVSAIRGHLHPLNRLINLED
ncbi:MAG: DUF6198 family protein [Aerococcus sp.]|nr:DUF6198 family protein [Aerococcus sp.]